MKKERKIDSRELGLVFGLAFGRYFMKTQHLHYGYWPEDLEVDILNISRAQENYCNFIFSQLPGGVKSILDVGCGTGVMARKLMDLGYDVDCVSPSEFLTRYARDLLGDEVDIYQCTYETMETEKRYDLILFCESFQYVDLKSAMAKSLQFLKDGGYLLICDFFRKDTGIVSTMGGGHSLSGFYEIVSRHPLALVEDIDITDKTAPNLDLAKDMLENFGQPAWNLIGSALENNYPRITRLLKWKYKRKIEKINTKYFSGNRNADNFMATKSYRFLKYQKTSEADRSDGARTPVRGL